MLQTIIRLSSAQCFDGIKEDIYSVVNKAKDYLKLTGNAEIVGYEIINKDVRITRFAGGGYTVVNYGEAPVATQYGEVAAGAIYTGGKDNEKAQGQGS